VAILNPPLGKADNRKMMRSVLFSSLLALGLAVGSVFGGSPAAAAMGPGGAPTDAIGHEAGTQAPVPVDAALAGSPGATAGGSEASAGEPGAPAPAGSPADTPKFAGAPEPAEGASTTGAAAPASRPMAPKAIGGAAPAAPDLPTDPKALWVVRDGLLSPDGIRRMVADAARAGVTDLFVQVRGRGDAYYESSLVPAGAPLQDAWKRYGHYDPLAEVLHLAHARGIRVHAWMNVYLVRSEGDVPEGHVTLEHPDWVAVDRSGTPMTALSARRLKAAWTEGAYLEPGNTEVVKHFVDVVTELLARYPVDGIHLDYVRYPVLDVGYSEAMRAGFRRMTGVDPLELDANEAGLRRERGDEGYAELQREWMGFKAAQVTAMVASVHDAVCAMRPEVMLSAAVKPDPDKAYAQTGQDWVRWVREGLVDVVAPMMYSTSASVVREQARELSRVVPPERVWAGIAVYNQSLAAAEAKIRTCRDAGLGGISIFSYNSLPGGGGSLVRLNRAR